MSGVNHSYDLNIRIKRSWELAVQPETFDNIDKDDSQQLHSSDTSLSPFIQLWLVLGTTSIILTVLVVCFLYYVWRLFGLSRFTSARQCMCQVWRVVCFVLERGSEIRVAAETTDTGDQVCETEDPEDDDSVYLDCLGPSESMV